MLRADSDAVYTTLRTSANSRFPSQWADDIEDDGYTMPASKSTIDKRWIGVIISFARRQEGDFTLKKYEEAQDNPRIFADKATTFEVNPQFDPDHPFYRHFRWEVIDELNIRVPSPYADEFRTDPTESATKYLCQPPPQEHGFFEIPKKIDACVDKNRSLPVVTPDIITRYIDQGEDQSVSQRYLKVHLDGLPEREKDCEYYIHGDPALYSDDFVVALAHKTPETMTLVDSEGVTKTVNRVVVDFIVVWKPKPGIPVDLLDVEEKILMLAKLYDVETVTYDRWNSANSIQRLFSAGIFSHDYSFSQPQQLATYRNLKALVHNDMVSLPDEPELLRELKLSKLKNGTTTSPGRTGPTRQRRPCSPCGVQSAKRGFAPGLPARNEIRCNWMQSAGRPSGRPGMQILSGSSVREVPALFETKLFARVQAASLFWKSSRSDWTKGYAGS